MSGLGGVVIVCAFAMIAIEPHQANAADAWLDAPTPNAADWQQIGNIASDFVAKETQAQNLPFTVDKSPVAGQSQRKIFIHYFPPYPLSFTNLAPTKDIYSVAYLRREGEGSKYDKVGGLVRDRPLPVGPWQSPYWLQINYAIDILRAKRMGADGFAFDIIDLHDGRYAIALNMMLDAAAQVAPDFKIVAEPDVAILKAASAADIEAKLAQIWDKSATFHLADERLLITPFAADAKPVIFWQQILTDMAGLEKPVALMPVLLDVGRVAKAFAPISYGESAWGDRDSLSPDLRVQLEQNGQFPASEPWMMPIAPQDARPNQGIFWEARNTVLYRKQWTEAIQDGSQYVQLITWNDYSESTHIEPSAGTQFVFYDLGMFYGEWFKTGHMPEIERDAIYYTHRRELFDPTRLPHPSDTAMKRQGTTPVENDIEMVAFLTSPGILQIEIGTNHYEKEVGAGIEDFRVPAQPGTPIFRIIRNGATAVETKSNWQIVQEEDALDPLYVGGSSNRPFVTLQ